MLFKIKGLILHLRTMLALYSVLRFGIYECICIEFHFNICDICVSILKLSAGRTKLTILIEIAFAGFFMEN